MIFHFTTLFDKNYLSRGIVLYESLNENCSAPFVLYILCLDVQTELFFNSNKDKYPSVVVIPLKEIEEADKELFACKNNRSLISYYFTMSPCLPLYILNKYKLEHICSLDADLLFLSDPKPLFDYLNEFSIIITPHKFAPQLKKTRLTGIFNVSFQIFKNDMIARNCLMIWREQCIDWCNDQVDIVNNRFADQKYLDNWPEIYNKNLKVLDDDVSGIAPWNIDNYNIELLNDSYFSNKKRIIFYHFHGFRIIHRNWAVTRLVHYNVTITESIKELYKNYLNKLLIHYECIEIPKFESIRNSFSSKIIENILAEKLTFYIKKRNQKFQIYLICMPERIGIIMLRTYILGGNILSKLAGSLR